MTDDDFEDMTEAEFDAAFADAEWVKAGPPDAEDGVTSHPACVTVTSFTGHSGLGGI